MKPLSEWTTNDLLYAVNVNRRDDLLAELLRREREAMRERCAEVCDRVAEEKHSLAVSMSDAGVGEMARREYGGQSGAQICAHVIRGLQ
jgi:hypothetical protein